MVEEIVEEMEKMRRGPLEQEVVRNLDKKVKMCAGAVLEKKEKENEEKNKDLEKEREEKQQAKVARMKEQEKADMELLTGTGPMEINR